MKKTIAAIAAGTLLVAGQAIAANGTSPTVGDRVGAASDASSEFAGGISPVLIFAAITVIAAIGITSINDDSDSD